MRIEADINEVLEYVIYDRDTGIFTSKKSRGNIAAGSIIGTPNGLGYLKFQINKKQLFSHRVAFLIENGYMPEFVDHINGIRDDNRIINLREVDKYGNAYNSSKKSNGSAQFKGISWHKHIGKWQVQIRERGKLISLGYFSNEFQAAIAYDLASIKIHGDLGRRNILPLAL